MKLTPSILILCLLSFSAFGQASKAKKTAVKDPKKGQSLLTVGIDFDPKKLFLRAKFNPNKAGEQKIFQKITVTNKTKESTLAKMVLYEFHPDEFGKNNIRKSKANIKIPELSLNDSISFPKDPISLNPGESRVISIEITANRSFVGTKYALFTFEKVNTMVHSQQSQKKSAVALELEILGSIILDLAGTGSLKVTQEMKGLVKDAVVVDVANVGDHVLESPLVEGVLFDSKMNIVDKFNMQSNFTSTSFVQKTKRRFVYHLTKKYPKGKYKLYTQFRAEGGTFSDGAKFDLEL